MYLWLPSKNPRTKQHLILTNDFEVWFGLLYRFIWQIISQSSIIINKKVLVVEKRCVDRVDLSPAPSTTVTSTRASLSTDFFPFYYFNLTFWGGAYDESTSVLSMRDSTCHMCDLGEVNLQRLISPPHMRSHHQLNEKEKDEDATLKCDTSSHLNINLLFGVNHR